MDSPCHHSFIILSSFFFRFVFLMFSFWWFEEWVGSNKRYDVLSCCFNKFICQYQETYLNVHFSNNGRDGKSCQYTKYFGWLSQIILGNNILSFLQVQLTFVSPSIIFFTINVFYRNYLVINNRVWWDDWQLLSW